jgi:hypothetical protein
MGVPSTERQRTVEVPKAHRNFKWQIAATVGTVVWAALATVVTLCGLPAAASARPAPAANAPLSRMPTSCLPSPTSPSSALYVADVGSSLGYSPDEQLMFAALQGIVNRSGPQIYLEGEVTDTTSATWLADHVVPVQTRAVSPYWLVTHFRSSIRGLVVWDPSLAVDTQNVATIMAGTDDLLPVSPALAAVLGALPYRLPIGADLRAEHFTNGAQAYAWALARFGPPRTQVLAWLGGDRNGLRDLVVACRGFVFQADPETDAALVDKILGAFPALTPVFGYPCLNDPVSRTSGVPVCEPAGVGEISASGKFLVPSDLATNLTVHAALASPLASPAWDDRAQAPDPTKTYVTFVISDGDNVGYNEQYLRQTQWSDPAHGSIPMGISIFFFIYL